MKKILSFPVFFIFIFNALAQPLIPDAGIVYTESEIPKIRITIHPDSLAYIYNNVYEDIEYHATMAFESSEHTETLENIGFGLRGNTSLVSAKKSFKISFNSFVEGRKFFGIEKMNLNGEHNDPSVIRSKLVWDVFRDFLCVGARSNHVEVYINETYYGLYLNTEHIDEEFVASRFGNNDGNLYKCLYPADLAYLGTDPELYKFESSGRRVYELKINETTDDYSDLAHFIDILNNTSSADLHLYLDDVFNTNAFLKVLCVDVLTGNWDGYSYNKNNFFLYHNTQTDRFEYIAYDVDNTFGIDWFNIDWAKRNIYSWSAESKETRPLYSKVLQNQVYRKRFTFYMNQLLSSLFNATYQFPKIDIIKALIQSSAENDLYRTYDYGWTIDDFNNSYDESLGAHVKYGLKPYISERATYAAGQLETTNTAPIISYLQSNKPRIYEPILIRCVAEDEAALASIVLKYRINSGEWMETEMFDDGTHNDEANGDRIFACNLDGVSGYSVIDYFVEAEDIELQTTREPVQNFFTLTISENIPPLYINEFMASNTNTYSDEFGEFDDWIEIYNAGSEAIYLGDKYLTDNLSSPKKWQMPDVSISAGGFIVFWADDSYSTQGNMHTNFKLGASGESIGIFDSDAFGNAQIDAINFGSQETDVSMGCFPDGSENYIMMPTPTPGANNVSTSTPSLKKNEDIFCYPNPVTNRLHLQTTFGLNSIQSISIFNSLGVRVAFYNKINILENKLILDFEIFPSGFYTIEIRFSNKPNAQYLKVFKD